MCCKGHKISFLGKHVIICGVCVRACVGDDDKSETLRTLKRVSFVVAIVTLVNSYLRLRKVCVCVCVCR